MRGCGRLAMRKACSISAVKGKGCYSRVVHARKSCARRAGGVRREASRVRSDPRGDLGPALLKRSTTARSGRG